MSEIYALRYEDDGGDGETTGLVNRTFPSGHISQVLAEIKIFLTATGWAIDDLRAVMVLSNTGKKVTWSSEYPEAEHEELTD